MSSYTILDDQDSRIRYYGDWEHGSVEEALGAWDNTVSATQAGTGAVFSFRGTAVGVVGGTLVVDSLGPLPIASFVLDGGEPWEFIAPFSYNNTLENALYYSGTIPDGQHTLNFTIIGPGSPYLIDYFLVQQTATDDAVVSSSASAASSSIAQQTIVTTVIIAPTGLASTDTSTEPRSDSALGPIVGGIIGGIVLLVASFVAVYFLYWRRRHRGRPYYYSKTQGADLLEDSKPRPYDFGPSAPFERSSTFLQSPMPHTPSRSDTSYAPSPPISVLSHPHEQAVRYPPGPQSEYSSVSGSAVSYGRQSTMFSVTNPDRGAGDASTATGASVVLLGMTPAQRKAAEAKADAETRSWNVRQHADSGQRFQRSESTAGGAGPSGSGESAVRRENPVEELPPAYSAE